MAPTSFAIGHLLTSSNYDDNEKKVTGGRNGLGAKLTNIYSTKFIIETGEKSTNKYYKQVFKNNMTRKEEPQITANKSNQDFTKITFTPEWERFNMNGLEDDTLDLLTKRVYDLAGVTNKRVKVWLNGELIQCTDFSMYADMYLKSKELTEELKD